jgi:hypothetical protein
MPEWGFIWGEEEWGLDGSPETELERAVLGGPAEWYPALTAGQPDGGGTGGAAIRKDLCTKIFVAGTGFPSAHVYEIKNITSGQRTASMTDDFLEIGNVNFSVLLKDGQFEYSTGLSSTPPSGIVHVEQTITSPGGTVTKSLGYYQIIGKPSYNATIHGVIATIQAEDWARQHFLRGVEGHAFPIRTVIEQFGSGGEATIQTMLENILDSLTAGNWERDVMLNSWGLPDPDAPDFVDIAHDPMGVPWTYRQIFEYFTQFQSFILVYDADGIIHLRQRPPLQSLYGLSFSCEATSTGQGERLQIPVSELSRNTSVPEYNSIKIYEPLKLLPPSQSVQESIGLSARSANNAPPPPAVKGIVYANSSFFTWSAGVDRPAAPIVPMPQADDAAGNPRWGNRPSASGPRTGTLRPQDVAPEQHAQGLINAWLGEADQITMIIDTAFPYGFIGEAVTVDYPPVATNMIYYVRQVSQSFDYNPQTWTLYWVAP